MGIISMLIVDLIVGLLARARRRGGLDRLDYRRHYRAFHLRPDHQKALTLCFGRRLPHTPGRASPTHAIKWGLFG